MLSSVLSVYADDNTAGHLFKGGYPASTVANLKFVISGGDAYEQSNIMIAGATAWNGISSKVNISCSPNDAKMSIWKTYTTTDQLFGETILYNSWWGRVSTDSTWVATDVLWYDNQFEKYRSLISSDEYDSRRKATITHEVGHALSLAHTSDDQYLEVMDQGMLDRALTHQYYDEYHLRCK